MRFDVVVEFADSPVMGKSIDRGIGKAGVHGARKHLFFCIGPDCCASEDGQGLWEYAKKRVKGLEVPVMRTKAACFRICTGGPWLVVYPEGIWYGAMTRERLERILIQHIEGGRPVREWVVAENPLARDTRAAVEE